MRLLLIIIICILGIVDFIMLKNEWEVMKSFEQTTCQIAKDTFDGYIVSKNLRLYKVTFHLRYTVNGVPYEGQTTGSIHSYPTSFYWWVQRKIKQYAVGNQYSCWYNPNDPSSVVLERGLSVFEGFLLILTFFLVCTYLVFYRRETG